MGSIILDIQKLNNFFVNPDNQNSWENQEIEKFIKRAFLIGKDKTIEENIKDYSKFGSVIGQNAMQRLSPETREFYNSFNNDWFDTF